MKSYILPGGIKISDLVEKYTSAEKLYVFQGRRPKLAFAPKDSLSLSHEDINFDKIIDFCQDNRENNNLVIGFLSYELGLYGHQLTLKNKSNFPAVELYSFANWVEEEDGAAVVKYQDENFLNTIKNLAKQPSREIKPIKLDALFQPKWDIKTYKDKFEKTKKYIESGDIYQMNLTYPLSAVCASDAKDIYIKAQKANQATMAGLFQSDDFDLISLSPETFINIEGRQIETFPIKGTRAKNTKISNKQIENELVNDSKEQAELNMISDLMRNDLGIICKPNSVKIKSRQNITRLRRVIHTYSHITGELDTELTPVEAILKILPGGSISGCPKKRALELIDKLEDYPRGPYTGCLFTLDPQDNLEANILIRTLIKQDSSLTLPVGGGIVFDSKYEDEYKETLDKASSIIEAFDSD